MVEDTSSTVKISNRKVDRHGNDIEHVKKVDELSIKTENLACPIHNKSFKTHTENELLEDYNLSGLRYQKSQGHLYHTSEIKPNEITSLAEMAKLGLSNYDLQAGVAASTKASFNSYLDFNGFISSIILKILDEVMGKPMPDKFKWLAALIGAKNQRLTGNCVNLTCDGYYESAMVLLRPAMENYLLLTYLFEHQNEVEDFYHMRKKYSSRDLVNYAKNKNKEFGSMWGLLCDNYVHSNIISLHTITRETENPEVSLVHLLPHYDEEMAQNNLGVALLFKLLTLTSLAKIFTNDIKNGNDLFGSLMTFGKVYAELLKNPKLQIDFVFGNKDNL